MYGHIPQYLDADKQRLRAERAEEQVRRWRVTAWMLLALLVAQTWLVIDTVMELTQTRHVAEQRLTKAREIASGRLDDALKRGIQSGRDLQACKFELQMARNQVEAVAASTHYPALLECQSEISLYSGQLYYESSARDATEEKFRVCLAANADLVTALGEFDLLVKEQQSVIRESIELARRRDAQPATWVTRIPAVSEVLW